MVKGRSQQGVSKPFGQRAELIIIDTPSPHWRGGRGEVKRKTKDGWNEPAGMGGGTG